MFGDGDAAPRLRQMQTDRSILDCDGERGELAKRLGIGDRRDGDYLDLRDVERRIQRAEQNNNESLCRRRSCPAACRIPTTRTRGLTDR
jgi:hypothetical protein